MERQLLVAQLVVLLEQGAAQHRLRRQSLPPGCFDACRRRSAATRLASSAASSTATPPARSTSSCPEPTPTVWPDHSAYGDVRLAECTRRAAQPDGGGSAREGLKEMDLAPRPRDALAPSVRQGAPHVWPDGRNSTPLTLTSVGLAT
jgi:hypothetical protein